MTKPTCTRRLLVNAGLFFGLVLSGAQLMAQDQQNQQAPGSAASETQQSQPSDQQTQSQPGQTPDQAGQPTQPSSDAQAAQSTPDSQAGQEQVFSGTIVKSGDKLQLQDASGKSYDLDHQDLAQKYVGTQVRVKGTLDPDGKTIHVK